MTLHRFLCTLFSGGRAKLAPLLDRGPIDERRLNGRGGLVGLDESCRERFAVGG